MKPFLFEWKEKTADLYSRPYRYTLVYADDIETAFIKMNKSLNPTSDTYEIRCATILEDGTTQS